LRCNKEMVDLETLDEEDIEFVHGLITRHLEYTRSTVAEDILKYWPETAKKFVKVFPKDFKRALKEHLEEAKTEVLVAQGQGGNGKKVNGQTARPGRRANGKRSGTEVAKGG
ncbi:MAG TPA: hypothetical protein VFO59_08795, partial [Dehalococcoidia bacterium]|nr:hypothetical protein [Dehalococcoidia bacterium]